MKLTLLLKCGNSFWIDCNDVRYRIQSTEEEVSSTAAMRLTFVGGLP